MRVAARVARFLAPRELIFRSHSGRVHYLVLTRGRQACGLGVVFLLSGWLAFSTVALLAGAARVGDAGLGLRSAGVAGVALPATAAAWGEGTGGGGPRSLEEALARSRSGRDEPDPALAGPGALVGRLRAVEGQLARREAENASLRTSLRELQRRLGSARHGEPASRSVASRAVEPRPEVVLRLKELEARTAAARQSQDAFVESLAERTRSGVDEVEKTVAMTGLDVELLLDRASRELPGAGGPFIPVAAGGSVADAGALPAGVASLGSVVERWERLQFVLRTLPLTAPLDHYYVGSSYGERKDPITGKRALHEGLDLSGPIKTPVFSTAPGRVVFAGRDGSYGRVVEIDHGLGVRTRYAHLHAIAVKVGDVVDYRDKIGLLGSSGRSTGPHLHYEVRIDEEPQDPMKFLKAGRYVFKG